jgi:uncharacterized phage infection (PIP) family protein YhgE
LTGWPKLVVEAQERLGISWPRLTPLTSEEIDSFLAARLRHHRDSPTSVANNPQLSTWLRTAFAILSRWAEEGEAAEDYATLDGIRSELDAAAPAFARLIANSLSMARKADGLDASLKETEDKLAKVEAAAAAQQDQVTELQGQLEEARAAHSASQATERQQQQQIAEISSRLDEARSQLDTLRAALDHARGELSHAQSELAQRRAEADDATAQLKEQQQSHVEELESQRVLLAGKHAQELQDERNRARNEIQTLRQEKRDTETRLAERFSEIVALTRMLGERENAARRSDEQVVWLREVSAVLLNGAASTSLKGRLSALLPGPIRLKKQRSRLHRSGIFDSDAYLAANPDVAEAGIDPLGHYINHGMTEGRRLSSDKDPME